MILPNTMIAELTYKCNHRCLFCSCPWEFDNTIKEKEISAEEWKHIFLAMKKFGIEQITFSGGEAILRDDIFKILNDAMACGYSLGLISNGKNIDREFLKELKKYNLLLSISVPGIESFERTTGQNNIEHVLNLFDECKKLDIKTVANIAVTKINFSELYENIAFPLLHGASYILLNRFLPGGRGLDNTQYLLSIDEINEMFDVAEEVLSRAGVYGHIGTELPYCIIKYPQKYKYLNIASLCAAGKSIFAIDPSGYIKVCNHSPKRICKWTEIENLEKNDYWNKFVRQKYIPSMCLDCKYLYTKCDGGCREAAHVYYGNIDDSDPCF